MNAAHVEDPELEAVAWNLAPLLDGASEEDGAAAVDRLLDDALQRAEAFSAAHAGRVSELDSDGLAAAMHALEAIQDLAGRAGSFAMLRFSTDTADPARGALLQRVQEKGTAIEMVLLFFDLVW